MNQGLGQSRLQSAARENPAAVALVAAVLGVELLSWVLPIRQVLITGSSQSLAWQFWRPMLYGFTSGGLLSALINALVLYLIGRGLERTVGSREFFALFWLSGLGAATVMVWVGPAAALSGAIAGVFGVISAYAVVKHRSGMDVRGDIVLITLLLVWGVVAGSSAWIGEVGGIAVGAVSGAVIAYAPWRDREQRIRMGMAIIAAVCLVLITLAWMLRS